MTSFAARVFTKRCSTIALALDGVMKFVRDFVEQSAANEIEWCLSVVQTGYDSSRNCILRATIETNSVDEDGEKTCKNPPETYEYTAAGVSGYLLIPDILIDMGFECEIDTREENVLTARELAGGPVEVLCMQFSYNFNERMGVLCMMKKY